MMRSPEDRMYREMAFIAYYFHWSRSEVLSLEHEERRRWCEEITRINRELSDEPKNVFDV